MEMNKTDRGFSFTGFMDIYETDCCIQKSSLASEDAIWLGILTAEPLIMKSKLFEGGTGWAKYPIPDDVHINTRMHLNREQVANMIPLLQKFVDTGDIN